MEERKKERVLFWDILKGLGIVSIVFGHSQNLGILIRVVYYYHLVVFFFVAGYLYHEERYGDKPFDFISRRLKNMWTPYICYGCLFVFLHNFMARHHMFEAPLYDTKTAISAVMNTFLLNCPEGPAAALWFVMVMLAAGAGFAFLMWLCRSFVPEKYRVWVLGLLCIVTGVMGIIFHQKEVWLSYHIQTSLLMVPVYYGGYLLGRNKIDIRKYVTWYGAVACAVLFWYYLVVRNESVELSMNVIPKGAGFYIVSFIGTYICCFAAKCLERAPYLGKGAALLGRYSFDIMALHFLVFKVIDGIYGRVMGLPVEYYGIFPHTYPELHVVYLIAGVLIPLFFAMAAKKVIHMAGDFARNRAGTKRSVI